MMTKPSKYVHSIPVDIAYKDIEKPGPRRAREQGEAYGVYLADHQSVTPHFYDTSSYHSPLSTIAEEATRHTFRAVTGYELQESPF